MKRLLAVVLMLLMLCAASASAESQYILPEGWYYDYYDSKQHIVAPSKYFGNNVYDSIWDEDCRTHLQMYHWGYGDDEWLKTMEISPNNTTPRYVLPEGWSYNSKGQIISEHGKVYDSIWDNECMFELQCIDWGYGDIDYMEKYLRLDGSTAELGDSSVSMALLIGAAAMALAGAAYARRKASHAA